MTRVYVVVEGATEESFVKEVLAPVPQSRQIYVTPIILGLRGHKGGNTSYARVKKDVVVLLKQHRAVYCSTMLDFYGLGTGFPGMPLPPKLENLAKVVRIEQAVSQDIVAEVPNLRPEIRFIPYLQLHEYEGLLFSDPKAFASSIKQPNLTRHFQAIRDEFPTPEDINDDPNKAPSKRVLRAYSSYGKVVDGTLAARAVGIDRMRQECPHFREWVQRLQGLVSGS